jgi:hypothetical protein
LRVDEPRDWNGAPDLAGRIKTATILGCRGERKKWTLIRPEGTCSSRCSCALLVGRFAGLCVSLFLKSDAGEKSVGRRRRDKIGNMSESNSFHGQALLCAIVVIRRKTRGAFSRIARQFGRRANDNNIVARQLSRYKPDLRKRRRRGDSPPASSRQPAEGATAALKTLAPVWTQQKSAATHRRESRANHCRQKGRLVSRNTLWARALGAPTQALTLACSRKGARTKSIS